MTFNEDGSVDVFGDDYWHSAFRMKDIVFNIMLSGVTTPIYRRVIPNDSG
jgi:hypothetical protein